MDANGVVDGVTVVDPGSGYTSRPDRRRSGTAPRRTSPTPAVAAATIGIGQIDVTSGGAGLRLRADRHDHRQRRAVRQGRQRHGDRRRQGRRHGDQRHGTRRRLPHARPQEVRRHASRPRAGGREQPRQLHPGRGPRHHHLPRHRLLRDRASCSTAMKFHREPAADAAARLRAALDERRARATRCR